MARNGKKGVFCLETDWWEKPNHHSSVRPVLELLAQPGITGMPFVHHDVATRPEFEHYLAQWTQARFDAYPILYLGMHGSEGSVHLGDRRKKENDVSIDELGELLEGRCKGRVLYFGSCNTLDVHGAVLNRFLRATGAVGMIGYRNEISWMSSSAFDILLLSTLQECSLRKPGLQKLERLLKQEAPGLVKGLHLRVHVLPS